MQRSKRATGNLVGPGDLTRFVVWLFLISTGINYGWEMAQMALYRDMPYVALSSWLSCLRASLGDALMTLAIWGIGALLCRSQHWFKTLRPAAVLILSVAGVLIATAVEKQAVAAGRWNYSQLMPVVPVLRVGLTPLMQLLLLPWPSMKAAEAVGNRRRRQNARERAP